jgi:hypothetical protein
MLYLKKLRKYVKISDPFNLNSVKDVKMKRKRCFKKFNNKERE